MHLRLLSFGSVSLLQADFRGKSFPDSVPSPSRMLRVCSLAGETLKTFAAEEFEGQTVKSLKTLVAKQMGVSRFQHRWLSEDDAELQEDSLVNASDVQLVVLDFVEAAEWEVEELFNACGRNLPDKVETLLRKPLSPDKMEYGQTALHLAADCGSLECLALLLEAGADKDAVTFRSNRRTALHLAAMSGHLEVVRLLLEVSANKDTSDAHGMTALLFAAQNGHLEVVRLLLEAGADKDATDTLYGATALHLASQHGHLEVVRLLLEAGADKDVTDTIYGTTPLHSAAVTGHLDIVRLLLEVGANKDVRDTQNGSTAMECAVFNGHQDVAQLLE